MYVFSAETLRFQSHSSFRPHPFAPHPTGRGENNDLAREQHFFVCQIAKQVHANLPPEAIGCQVLSWLPNSWGMARVIRQAKTA